LQCDQWNKPVGPPVCGKARAQMHKAVIAAVSLITFAMAIADDNADQDIFIDYPVGLWTVNSTGTMNEMCSVAKKSLQYSIQVSLPASTNFQIFHTWGGQDSTGFTALQFWMRGAEVGNQNFGIRAQVRGEWGPTVQLSQYARIGTSWRMVKVPLADLGVMPGDRVRIISFEAQNAVPTFYIDDIKLAKAVQNTAATVAVDAGTQIRVFSERMFGIGTFTWDSLLATDETRSRMSEAGIKFLNFPGGCAADEYDWETNSSTRGGAVGAIDTEAYLQIAQSIGADKMITVNYGSGTPEKAAAWVHYANIVKGGNVVYWSIGNETYHPEEYDQREGIYRHDAETYAAFVRDCIIQMKAIDPRIKIGIVGTIAPWDWSQRSTVINPRTGQAENGWAPVLLTRLREWGTLPDYYDFHHYPIEPGTESDATLMQMTGRIGYVMSFVRQMLSDYLGDAGASMPVLLTETNSVWMPAGKQSTSITNALYLADFWGQCNLAGLDSFVWWNLHNSAENLGNMSAGLYGFRNHGTFGVLSMGIPEGLAPPVNFRYPTFYAIKAISAFARPGDSLVSASSNSELLGVYACRAAATGALRLLVVNKGAAKDFAATIKLTGYVPRTTRPTIWRYSAKEDLRGSDISRLTTTISPRTVSGVTTIRMSFPRYSITVVEL
jgi:alpha-N-arabinofuranosidase